ncbi:MAG TPA: DUF4412 domain-containing protein [Candidatus Saccharimonadales bacterium]|nr:DUF4412 domain-containing protein [Candidatus Saccharimonadales bacterium]
MRLLIKRKLLGLTALTLAGLSAHAAAFQGRITATFTRGGQALPILYTVGSNSIRIEVTGSTYPHPVNIVDRPSGALTMVYPHNRSFMRMKASADGDRNASPAVAFPPSFSPAASPPLAVSPQTLAHFNGRTNFPAPPGGLPPGVGPQAGVGIPPGFGPGASMPMPMPAMAPQEKIELLATTNKNEILGYACTRYDATNRAERLEVWATDKLLPFIPYTQTSPARFGPRMLEDQWPDWLKSRGLFPIKASLRFENGPERFHFEVLSIKAEKIIDTQGKLFQPPDDYHETEPLPF